MLNDDDAAAADDDDGDDGGDDEMNKSENGCLSMQGLQTAVIPRLKIRCHSQRF